MSERIVRDHLMRIAETIRDEFMIDESVLGIAAAGSLSRGPVDGVSDIDIMVYRKERLPEGTMDRIIIAAKESGGGFYGGTENEGFAFWRCLQGVKVDIGFHYVKEADTIIESVQKELSLDNDSHLILDGIQRSLVLFEREETMTRMKNRIDQFPEELAVKMIESNLRMPPLWITRDMSLGRGDIIWYQELLLDYLRRMLWVLCGLNRRYYPGKLKGFDFVAGTLPVAPQQFRDRAVALVQVDSGTSLLMIPPLVEELYQLVETEFPAIDAGAARKWFHNAPPCQVL